MSKKFREFIAKYGPAAIGTQIGVSLTWLGSTYALVKWGLDYNAVADKLGFDYRSYARKIAENNKQPIAVNATNGEQGLTSNNGTDNNSVSTTATSETSDLASLEDIQQTNTEQLIKEIENGKVKMLTDFTIAFILYKGMAPIRVPVIFNLIPIVAKIFRRAPKV